MDIPFMVLEVVSTQCKQENHKRKEEKKQRFPIFSQLVTPLLVFLPWINQVLRDNFTYKVNELNYLQELIKMNLDVPLPRSFPLAQDMIGIHVNEGGGAQTMYT
jgi:hypothetical protein